MAIRHAVLGPQMLRGLLRNWRCIISILGTLQD